MNLHLTHFLTLAGYWMGLIKMPNFYVFHPELIKFFALDFMQKPILNWI